MNGFLNRVARVFSANAHNAVDQMERPEAMLSQLQRELVEASGRTRLAVNQALAWRREVEQRLARTDEEITRTTEVARMAIGNGEDDMARAAIARKQARETQRSTLARQLQQAEAVLVRQRERQKHVQDELKALREKRVLLTQRSRFARSITKLGVDSGMPEPIDEVVQRLEEKVNAEEALADVLLDDDTAGIEEPGLDSYMRDQRIDSELARLWAELNQGDLK